MLGDREAERKYNVLYLQIGKGIVRDKQITIPWKVWEKGGEREHKGGTC